MIRGRTVLLSLLLLVPPPTLGCGSSEYNSEGKINANMGSKGVGGNAQTTISELADGGEDALGGASTGGAEGSTVTNGGTGAAGSATADGGALGGTQGSGGDSTQNTSTGGVTTTVGTTDVSGTCIDNNTDKQGAANIDLSTQYQNIRGFGGVNMPGWIPELTSDQVDKAFGTAPGQIGLTILRIRIPYDQTRFNQEVHAAHIAVTRGAKVVAAPWTPPPELKTNGSSVGGRLDPAFYGTYADHLLSFRDYMQSNGVPIYAISVQNEPDATVSYESCSWDSTELISWLKAHGSKFGDTKLMAAESYKFDRSLTDPILTDSAAAEQVDIIAGHINGGGLDDYPLARTMGKEVWMTEHHLDDGSSGDAWPLALDVGKEIHDCMTANFSAYVWWYIRRSDGLLAESGRVSKRGHLMAQYARFVRPGSIRIGASAPSNPNVFVTAYNNAPGVVVVAVNTDPSPQTMTLNIKNGCVLSLTKYTTSSTKNVFDDGTVTLTANAASVTLDGQSVTTFVSQ